MTIARLASFAKKSGARVIISSTPGIFLSLEAYLVARLLRLGFILDVRDSWSLEMVTHEGKLRNLIKHWIEGIICRGASLTWTVTESLRTLLVNSHHLPPRKILVVPNGADLSKFSPGRGPKEYDFVFLGAPSPYRDVPRLLCGVEAWADRSPRLHGLWIGWREPSLSKEDLARLRRLVEKGVLVLKSPIPHEEVPALLQSAKIGIVSLSAHEVFRTAVGAKVYEYLATALALLCLGPPGDSELRRFVEGGKFGLFTTTPEEFATRGAQLVNNPEMLNEFSANCLAGAAQYDRVTVFRNALATPPNPLSGIS